MPAPLPPCLKIAYSWYVIPEKNPCPGPPNGNLCGQAHTNSRRFIKWRRVHNSVLRQVIDDQINEFDCPSLSASCAQAQKSLEHSVEQKSHSFANLAPRTRHIWHRLSCASVPPDFIDQKEKGISDQSEGEIDENSVFHCFPHKRGRHAF